MNCSGGVLTGLSNSPPFSPAGDLCCHTRVLIHKLTGEEEVAKVERVWEADSVCPLPLEEI